MDEWLTASAAAPVAAPATAAATTTPAAPGLKAPSRRGLFKALPDGTPPTPDCPAASCVHADPCSSEHADPCNSEPSCGTAGAAWGAFSPPTHWPVAAAAAGVAAAGAATAAVGAAAWRRRRLGRRRRRPEAARAAPCSGSSTEDDCDSEEEAVSRRARPACFRLRIPRASWFGSEGYV